jgi:hypothetical protein
MSIISSLKSLGKKFDSLAQKGAQTVSNVGNKLEDYVGKSPTIQANLHPITSIKKAYSEQPPISQMSINKLNFGITPQNQLTTNPIVEKIRSYQPQNKVLRFGYNQLFNQGSNPEDFKKIQQAIVAEGKGSATPEQKQLAQSGATNTILNAGFMSGGVGVSRDLESAAKLIANTKSANTIKGVLKESFGIEAQKAGKSFIKDLITETNPEKVKNMIELLKPVSQKAQTLIPKAQKAIQDAVAPLSNEAAKYKSGEEFYQTMPRDVRDRFQKEKGLRYKEEISNYWEQATGKKNVDSYQMSHRPSENGATADNISKGGELMPDDVYQHPEWYFNMNQPDEYGVATKESFNVVKSIKGNPNAEVTIYRASPSDKINSGDWVTLSKKYAETHAGEKMPVHSYKVKAKDIQFAGDDINEFGYFPKTAPKVETPPITPKNTPSAIEPLIPPAETGITGAKGEVAKELGLIEDKVKEIPTMVKKYPGYIRRTWDKFSGQGPYLRDTSEEGRQVMREILTTRADMDFAQNNAAQVFNSWLKKYKPGKSWVNEVESGAGTPMAKNWNQLTDEIYNEATGVGFTPAHIENYVKRIWDWSKKDQMVRDISSNRGISIGDARQVLGKTKKVIDEFEHILTNPGTDIGAFVTKVKNSSLEFSRMEIPPELEKYRVTDPKAVIMHMIDTVGDIARAKKLGVANDKLVNLVSNLPDSKSIDYAMNMIKQLGRVQEKTTGADKIADMAKRFETLTKLQWGSALQNLTQNTYTAGYAGIPRTTKNILTSLPQLLSGGAKKASELGVSEANRVIPTGKGQQAYNALFKAGGFPTTETFNKIVSAKSGSEIVTGKFNRLLKVLDSGNVGKFNKLRKELEDIFMVDVQKAVQEGKLSPEEIKRAGWGLTHKTQFLHPEFEMPSILTAKGVKGLPGQFKAYIWNQPKLIYQSVKEAATGSPRKLINQMVMAMLLGYPLAKASDALFKREDSKSPLTVLKYGMGGSGLGILESLWTSAKYGQTTGAIAGPVISDFGTLINNIYLAYNGNPKQLKKQLINDIPMIGYYLRKNMPDTKGSTKGSTQKSTTSGFEQTGKKFDSYGK